MSCFLRLFNWLNIWEFVLVFVVPISDVLGAEFVLVKNLGLELHEGQNIVLDLGDVHEGFLSGFFVEFAEFHFILVVAFHEVGVVQTGQNHHLLSSFPMLFIFLVR